MGRNNWYAIRSRPHKEFLLHAQLQARDIECYFPRIRVNPTDPRSAKIRPFFPSYMFVKTNLGAVGINTFNRMPYAQKLVSFGGEPVVVPENIISGMQKNIGDIYTRDNNHPDRVKPGTRIRVIDGPFRGYAGIFDAHLDDHERVKVLLELLDDRQMSIHLKLKHIETRK